MDKFKFLLTLLGGFIASALKTYTPIFIAAIVAMAFDWITGVIAAKQTGKGWSSDVARHGVLKKGMMMLMLGFGVFLDYMLPMAVEHAGFTFDVGPMLASNVISFYIIFTECISVCENFYECSPDSFPKWIVKLLAVGKQQLDKLGEGEVDNK